MFIEEFPLVPILEPRETLREAALSVIIEGPVVIEILGVRTHQAMHFQWTINRGSLYYGLLCPSYKLEELSGVLCSHKFQEEALFERRPTKSLQWDNTSRSWYYMTLPSLCNLTLDCDRPSWSSGSVLLLVTGRS